MLVQSVGEASGSVCASIVANAGGLISATFSMVSSTAATHFIVGGAVEVIFEAGRACFGYIGVKLTSRALCRFGAGCAIPRIPSQGG